MRKTIVVMIAVLGLIGSASVGTTQVKSEIKGTQWEGLLICSKGQGEGKFSLTLHDDSTYMGKWTANCLGYRAIGSGKGVYKRAGSDISFKANGFARADAGSSSRYTIHFSGNILETTINGTYEMLFDEEEWPQEVSGTWELEKVK